MDKYNVFTRNWYTWGYENGKRVKICRAGRKSYIKRGVTRDQARDICKVYNNNHNPGVLSRKAEFEER